MFGQGFVVDGVDDYVSVPDAPAISFTSAFTLAAWVNPTAPNNGVVQGVVAKSRPGGGTGYRMAVENGKVAIGLNNDGVNCLLTSSTSVAAGQWSLITVSFGAGSLKAYLNGALFGTASCSFSTLQDSAEPLYIGRELSFLDRYFTGTIDQVRAFNRVLSDPEVNNLYDFDCDTFPDHQDNCPTEVNPDQADGDGDNIGDVCDNAHDNDSVVDTSDNCPTVPNADQADNDNDGAGDACDVDDDNDGVPDTADNCSLIVNPGQEEFDHDGIGNACDGDRDRDGDGVANTFDNCPVTPNGDQLDFDADGQGDACDTDIDGDGVLNGADVCAFTPSGVPVDATTGCSIAQLCPCSGPRGTTQPWKNHGQYVSCVTKSAQSFVQQGLITSTEKGVIVSAAGQSNCGK